MTSACEALPALCAAWVAILGAMVGSFLNVVVARVPHGLSIVRPGSRCPRCATPIRWYDNLPVLSFLLLRGRCRTCKERISARYPLIEVMGALVALVAYGRHGFSASALGEFAFAAALVALAFIDLDNWLLPHVITWPLIAFGLVLGGFHLTPAGQLPAAALGAALGFAAFALVSWLGEKAFKKEALGFGDVWLLSGLCAFLGAKALLPVVLLASVEGAVVGVALILLGRLEKGPKVPKEGDPPQADEDAWVPPRHALPFGPFLVAGALEWLWLGHSIARLVPVLELFR
ncbi:MAG TPA: prepilin peptidase [Anaeromyxobacteraceae bacterium]|nr:prepilin peptidase [Anaeromyxobacteraceae bacterium]